MWLRERLAQPSPLMVYGAYDALSARGLEQSGAECVYLGSYALTASSLAGPDVGLLSFGEGLEIVRRICSSVTVPVIVDIDTGYGGVSQVRRTVSEYARAGVAAVQIEDQENPKKCGHFQGKVVVPLADASARVAAAVETADAHGMGVVARTDALAPLGLETFCDQGPAGHGGDRPVPVK